jgi:hypothetical protein
MKHLRRIHQQTKVPYPACYLEEGPTLGTTTDNIDEVDCPACRRMMPKGTKA